MSSLLVPVTKVVIGHDIDNVQVLSNHVQLVGIVDNSMVARDGSHQLETIGLEGLLDLLEELGVGSLVRLLTIRAARLPTHWVLPIDGETVELVLLQEGDGLLDEVGPLVDVVDQL